MKREKTFAEMWRALSGGQQQAIAEKLARAHGAENLENVFRAVLRGEVRIRLEDATKICAVVPDISPAGLVALAQDKIWLTYSNPDFDSWDFCQYRVEVGRSAELLENCGRRYEVLTWKPGQYVTTQQVRDHFDELGADGDTSAFMQWIFQTMPVGYHATISNTELLYFDSKGFHGFSLGYGGADIELGLRDDWAGSGTFVAFRQVF